MRIGQARRPSAVLHLDGRLDAASRLLHAVAREPFMELGHGPDQVRIPILYEDRAVLAIDKPTGWMLVPFQWQKTRWNLPAAVQSSIGSGAFWARSRGIRFLRYIHRLDGDTSGILLWGKSPGAVNSLAELFESRAMEKRYLAVVLGHPPSEAWWCSRSLGKDPDQIGRIRVDARHGKPAETHFRVLAWNDQTTLIEASPVTGRTHQIRVHLASDRLPIVGDVLYGGVREPGEPLALRAVKLQFVNPFDQRTVCIEAPVDEFLARFGYERDRPDAGAAPEAPAREAASVPAPRRSKSSSQRLRHKPPP